MLKKKIRQQIEDIKGIINLWVEFYNLIRDTHMNQAITKEQEDTFLSIKTELARKQQVVSGTPLKLMNILSQATTLADMIKMPELQLKKFYTDWHETYLSLNDFLGRLESGKIEPERSRPIIIRQKGDGHGCLYNFVLVIVFLILIYIALRIYDQRRHLIYKIRETSIGRNQKLEETLQALGFKGAVEEEIEEGKEGEETKGEIQ